MNEVFNKVTGIRNPWFVRIVVSLGRKSYLRFNLSVKFISLILQIFKYERYCPENENLSGHFLLSSLYISSHHMQGVETVFQYILKTSVFSWNNRIKLSLHLSLRDHISV